MLLQIVQKRIQLLFYLLTTLLASYFIRPFLTQLHRVLLLTGSFTVTLNALASLWGCAYNS